MRGLLLSCQDRHAVQHTEVSCRTSGCPLCTQDIHVTGVDANPAMQSYCRAAADAAGVPQASLKLVVGDVAALPFPDASFDAVVCTLVCAMPQRMSPDADCGPPRKGSRAEIKYAYL